MNQKKSYKVPENILKKYAEVLVNFALNSGKGMKKEEVVEILVPDIAKPLGREIRNLVLKKGGYPIFRLLPTKFDKDYYFIANNKQLEFFPEKYLKAKADLIDHQIGIIADVDPFELSQIDPKKIMLARNAKKKYRDWLIEKENQNKFTWVVGLWGTYQKAKEVNLSLEKYWEQIIYACFLDKQNPLKEWKKVYRLQHKIIKKLNNLKIEYIKVSGKDINMKIKIGKSRIWKGGSGRNIPSFEIFTSPDWREVEGKAFFNQPLYRYGNLIKDISLEIKEGKVVKAKAKVGNKFLQEMLKTKNADKIGEFSLTDKRMSRITHVMAETLYDENIGGKYGNTHIALGMAYKDCLRDDPSKLKKKDWEDLGFNDSAEHCDIVSTSDRTVEAIDYQGRKQIIYKNGMFV